MFLDNETSSISDEHKDQIFALNSQAANFLWNVESQFKIFGKEFFQGEFFQDNIKWNSEDKSDQEIKKWLYNLSIPFSNKVFVSIQPAWGFIMTWKMVIKNHDGLFRANDQTIWDKTLNWGLAYDHNDEFYFGKNRIYNSDIESEKLAEHNRMIQEAMEQIEKNKNIKRDKFLQNPYLIDRNKSKE
ncbi:MAG: hypothetical protein NVV82_12265 [Sporocytophaga sp.]|nr:hypothetical protein [Sporocytophaga sp.]